MQHIIEGFLNFQKEIFPSVKSSSAAWLPARIPKRFSSPALTSRLVPELVTQQEPGQLFVIRNTGNISAVFRAGAGRCIRDH